jgi:hypothetical protein
MSSEAETQKTLSLLAELEKRVALLETRMDNQYSATESLLRRVSKLERLKDSGDFYSEAKAS